MTKQLKPKKSLRTIITTAAAGALLLSPASAVLATNNRDSDNGDQNSARQFSRQRGERQDRDGWWNDWRYGEGKEWWENRPKTCEQRQDSAQRETDRLKRSSDKQLQKLSWQVDYQKWYVERYQLSPEDFDALVATADTDKTEVQAAINALVAPTVDCNQPTENDKTLLQQNKQPVLLALRDYHVDAVNITYAVQAAR